MTNHICQICEAVVSEDDSYFFDDTVMCDECYHERITICDHCDSTIWIRNDCGDTEITLCRNCYDNHYNTCSECSNIIHNDATFYLSHSDSPLCNVCYDDMCDYDDDDDYLIHDYSYKPSPRFYGNGDRLYGVELEIDGAGTSSSNASEILDTANRLNEHIYLKRDGSLNDGFEIVTHPMTLSYHMESMPWSDIADTAVSLGYTSHNALTCGLHIHVNRDSFGDSESEQDEVIARILYFIENHWNELLRFSRRTQYQLERWAARYGRKDNPKEILDNAKKSNISRYTCVNILNRHTVEFRFFRGTLRYETLTAAIQMTDEICNVAAKMSDNEIKQLSWSEFVCGIDSRQKPELTEYLKLKQLYINEPISRVEEI